jgi:hypothetical protein
MFIQVFCRLTINFVVFPSVLFILDSVYLEESNLHSRRESSGRRFTFHNSIHSPIQFFFNFLSPKNLKIYKQFLIPIILEIIKNKHKYI